MTAYTDYPMITLGDTPYEEAPIREVRVLDYDGDKYCHVLYEGLVFLVKLGYLYKQPGRFGEVEQINLLGDN